MSKGFSKNLFFIFDINYEILFMRKNMIIRKILKKQIGLILSKNKIPFKYIIF